MRRLIFVLLMVGMAVPASALQATVTWTDLAAETGYKVERRDGPDTAAWVAKGTVAANVTSYNESGLAAAMRYCYRVTAQNTYGDGAPSTPACADTNPPGQVSGITIIIQP